MRVLVAEDDVRLAAVLDQTLSEAGWEVEVVHDGRAAYLQALPDGVGYDVLLLDWMLPDLDGVAVCRRLRDLGVTTPVLMLTARGDVRDRVTGLDAGADDYLVKPFDPVRGLAGAHDLPHLHRTSAGVRRHQRRLEPRVPGGCPPHHPSSRHPRRPTVMRRLIITALVASSPCSPSVEGFGKVELDVHSNGCYTVGGPSKIVGFQTLTDTSGDEVPNPVLEFDGCFDPHGDNTPTVNRSPSLLQVTTTALCQGTVDAKAGDTDLGTVPVDVEEEQTANLAFPTPVPAGATSVDFTITVTRGIESKGPVTETSLDLPPR